MRSAKAAGQTSLVSVALVTILSGPAMAQGTAAAGDKVAAEALFETARKLVADGNFVEACPKFADSERLDPSPSTLLNLANCWEKLGRSATAWATYKEAESAASAARRQDYVAIAQRHADALAPTLSRLTITVAQPVAAMRLKRDGVEVAAAQWGVPIPIDRGSHSVVASAPGFREWATTVDVAKEGSQIAITIPALEALPPEPPSPVPAPTSVTTAAPAPPAEQRDAAPPGSPQRTIGIVVGAAGVVGLGISGVFAFIANNKNQDSLKDCSSDRNRCSATGVTLRQDALSAGDASTVAFGVGAAALATGVVLWLTARHVPDARDGAAARVSVTAGLGGAVVEGSWR